MEIRNRVPFDWKNTVVDIVMLFISTSFLYAAIALVRIHQDWLASAFTIGMLWQVAERAAWSAEERRRNTKRQGGR